MSVTFNIKREGIVDTVDIPSQEISASLLQKLLAQKLSSREQDLTLFNAFTGLKIGPMEMIKDKSIVHLERLFKSQIKINATGIVSNQQLIQMGKKARYFMIKSSNQQNIQKAREFSVWATTYANQDKLRSALLYCPHIFLLFATNRSYELKGLARMEKEPAKNPEKAFWSGVSNIRLGGNFQIRWVRKTPLTSLQIQKALGSQIKDRVMRLSDGEQIDGDLAIKVIPLFQVPTQPYYSLKQQEIKVIKTTEISKKIIPSLGQILGNNRQGFVIPTPILTVLPFKSQIETLPQPTSEKKQQKQQKTKKKQNKKKKKDKRRQHSDSSSSSSQSSYSSSSSSRSSSDRSQKKKKIKKQKKDKRKQRRRSRSRSKQDKRNRSESSQNSQSRRKKSKKDKKKKKYKYRD